MPLELKGDPGYWAEVEELPHCFGVPEQHDESCFFHPESYEKLTIEDSRRDFCPRCQKLMIELEVPLDLAKLHSRVKEI